MPEEFLREINHDRKTPRNQRKLNEDGFFEATDDTCCNGNCACDDEQVVLRD